MWLVPLLLIAQGSQAYDGCGLQQWRCGDVCIQHNSKCHCGNQTTFFKEKDRKGEKGIHSTWCCAVTPCTGIDQPSNNKVLNGSYELGANCSVGQVLELTQPCPKTSPSLTETAKIQTNEKLGGNATHSCNDNNEPRNIGSLDVPVGLRSYVPCWGPKQKVNECFKKSHEGDQKYHCKNRRDEKPFSKDNHKNVLFRHTNLLKGCTDENNKAGLYCGTTCLRFDSWCQEKPINLDGPIMCYFPNGTEFPSNDKRLCSHPTFWKDKECTEYRCNGAFPGQCGSTALGLGITN